MKKSVLVFAMILIGFSSFAGVNDKPNKLLSAQVITLLDDLPLEIEEEMLVEVKLKINQQNQIEVLAVAADDPLVRKLIKKRLDNKMLIVPVRAESSYHLPIRIKL